MLVFFLPDRYNKIPIEKEGYKMHTINYIIDDYTISKITKNKSWIETYIPEIAKELEKQGFKIVFDKKSDFDLMHVHIPLRLAYELIAEYSGNRNFPIVYHGHATEGDFTIGNMTKQIILRKWIKKIADKSDLIICASKTAEKYYRTLLPGHRIERLNYGVNLEKYSYSKEARKKFRKQYGIGENETVVCCVGGISIRKGIDEFINVSARHPNLRFMWVGGEYAQNTAIDLFYKVFAREGDVHNKDIPQHILTPGYLRNIKAALSASDIFFFPSRYENQGLALVEAAANARPIIIRDLPVFHEWLTDRHDCLMGKNADEFSAHIKAIAENPDLASKLGKNALKSAKKHHDIKKTSKKLAEIYLNLIANYKPKNPGSKPLAKKISAKILDQISKRCEVKDSNILKKSGY